MPIQLMPGMAPLQLQVSAGEGPSHFALRPRRVIKSMRPLFSMERDLKILRPTSKLKYRYMVFMVETTGA